MTIFRGKIENPKVTGKIPSRVKTAGGDYPVYEKGSFQADSFQHAFKSAREAGEKVFEWQGRKYNTKLKGEL